MNFEKIKNVVHHYCNAVGVSAVVINMRGEPLLGGEKLCGFCKAIGSSGKSNADCANSYLYGAYQSERFGGRYIFFCPMGLTHFASPIFREGVMDGAIVAGPVLMVDHEEYWDIDIKDKRRVSPENEQEAKKCLLGIPFFLPQSVKSLSEQLFVTSCYLSDGWVGELSQNADREEQQSDISGYIHYIKTLESAEDKPYPLEKERQLLAAISSIDKGTAQRLLNEILGYVLFRSGGDFQIIKARVLELVVILSRAALEGGADNELIFGMNYRYLSEIHQFNAIDQLMLWLSRIMIRFTDCVFNFSHIKHVDVIYKAVDYIKRHYAEKLTLEEVSGQVFLSPSYFSKVFKDEMGCTFNAYLNQTRIENSKRMLLDDSINLADISNMSGYEDQSYFSKVFKKNVGVSPGKYREKRGRLN